jgi:hypothetical protein
MSKKITNIYLGIIVIALLFYWYFNELLKKKKQDLNEVEAKIKEKEKLDLALRKKTTKIIMYARGISVVLFFSINSLLFLIGLCSIEQLLSINTITAMLFAGASFVKFGTFDGFSNWWHYIELLIETKVYRKTPDLSKSIENDKKFKAELEKEIEDIGSIFKN